MPVAAHVRAHAMARPHRPALRSPHGVCTYGELAAEIDVAAGRLWRRGARPGELVAVDAAEPGEMLTTMLAVDTVGAIPLVCDPAWSAEQRGAVLETVAPDHHVRELPREDAESAAGAAFPHRWEPRPHDLAWAGFSSGSTGRPRAIVRTRASWTGSYAAAEKLSGLSETDTVLVPGPLVSSLFCFAVLHGLAVGAEVVVTGRWSPRAVRELLPGVDVVHAVPHMLEAMLPWLQERARPRVAMVSGAALASGLRERAGAVGLDVIAYYGAVELSFVAVDADGSGLRPFDQVEIELRPAGDDAALGEVWVRSPWMAEGYLAGATGPFRRDGAGWATVGDLAERPPPMIMNSNRSYSTVSVHDHGRLRLRGRGDGAILTGGATVVPEDVEAVLAAVPGVRGAVVVGTPHEHLGAVVTALIEIDDARPVGSTADDDGRQAGSSIDDEPPPVTRATLEAVARRELTTAQRPRRWFAVERIPRTAIGKPARAAISAGVVSGTLDVRPLR
ncbi:AMP-binding protein [Phytoactinopolyspora halotolerans]|uniref:AMP-binding protein n=1 Tax=Phytoactinopolyspora halotolerans TaxID=1981512 RepID=A0A6L9SFD9_9ACTN|nr:AMP-binding protein [Phytoactinopolyspora halotolerans]NEE03364.1 AMP-binding protein [Phytoactinopolyspora halotolerans]